MTAEELNTKNLQCTYCSKIFKYESERKRHEQSHSLHFQCHICSKKFNFLSALRRHEKQHERKGSVQCEECGRNFRDEILLKRHINYAHKGTFICEDCKACFSSKPALHTHMKIHRPEAERRYKCSYFGCRKAFNFPHHLKHHELTHTNEKQHFCSVCGKGFIQSHHLKAHLRTHDPENWLFCVVSNCKKRFATEYARKRHLTTHSTTDNTNNNNIQSHLNEDLDYKIVPNDTQDIRLGLESRKSLLPSFYIDNIINMDSKSNLKNNFKPPDSLNVPMTITNDVEVVRNCQTVLGGCLLESEGGECVCIQMSGKLDDTFEDLIPVSNINAPDKAAPEIKLGNQNFCEGCECADICGIKDPDLKRACMEDMRSNMNKSDLGVVGTIKVVNGTVKLNDSWDISISGFHDKDPKVSYNTCQEALGRCIVTGSENGDTECLCAQMKLGVEMTEEIEKITPKPVNIEL